MRLVKCNRKVRLIAFLLAIVLGMESFVIIDFLNGIKAFGAVMEVESTHVNLLKSGTTIDFYGHQRETMWKWKAGGKPFFCVMPGTPVKTGASGEYYDCLIDDINSSAEVMESMTIEQRELLYYALACGNAGYNVTNLSNEDYALTQSVVWAVLSGEWSDTQKFKAECRELAKYFSSAINVSKYLAKVDNYADTVNAWATDNCTYVPAFGSKFKSTSVDRAIGMALQADGTYTSSTFHMSPEEQGAKYDFHKAMPDGWEAVVNGADVTFICRNGNPNLTVEVSAGRNDLRKPHQIGYLNMKSVQHMIGRAVDTEWSIWLTFGSGATPPTPPPGEANAVAAIEIHRYEHEETFDSNYKIKIDKKDYETGQLLEGAKFDILEAFDAGQLEGTNLESSQFSEDIWPRSWTVCETETTDNKGHIVHSDSKSYLYSKTYCGGHPDPVLTTLAEPGDEATDEEKEACDQANEEAMEAAWQLWQEEVELCEEMQDETRDGIPTHYHSIDEGVAEDEMEGDRDLAFDAYIHLQYDYTAREAVARAGYILHDLHSDDVQVDTVTFASSQADGTGEVTGKYAGNQISVVQERPEHKRVEKAVNNRKENLGATPSIAVRESNLSYAPVSKKEVIKKATPSNGEREENKKKEATPSNALTSSLLALFELEAFRSIKPRGGSAEGGWDGNFEPSMVSSINQSDYENGNTGYLFTIYDHRTEGEIHFNKRDLELYQNDADDSYGKAQGNATLEGAVYGLYAASDLTHPDGKSGVVFQADDLIAVAATDVNGDGSFVVITEPTQTSEMVTNLYVTDGVTTDGRVYSDNKSDNGNQWIGRPLLLGNYYIKEISRSEGYELSQYGINHTETNLNSAAFPIALSGSVTTSSLHHRTDEWDGSWNDFEVKAYKTLSGYDMVINGYPAGSKFYEVTQKMEEIEVPIVTGSSVEQKRDESGNLVFKTAEGGEYRYDTAGNKIIKQDGSGNPVYTDQPEMELLPYRNRLPVYPSGTPAATDPDRYAETIIDTDFIKTEVNDLLGQRGYKTAKDFSQSPWITMDLSGGTNGDFIEAIYEACVTDSFPDSYFVEEIVKTGGKYKAVVRYDYAALKGTAFYHSMDQMLYVKREFQYKQDGSVRTGYYYSKLDNTEFTLSSGFASAMMTEVKAVIEFGDDVESTTVYIPEYLRYVKGEYLLDETGNKIPVMETVYSYGTEIQQQFTEELKELNQVDYNADSGIYSIHIENDTDWEGLTEAIETTYRAVLPDTMKDGIYYADYVLQHGANVTVYATIPEAPEGSYTKPVTLTYHDMRHIYQDGGTREKPVIVLQRMIKQAIKVTKDIAQDSYENVNTYNIHKDPFTVIFGGYGGKPGTKTLKGFTFKLYLKSDLEETGLLEKTETGENDYEKLFLDHPELAGSLALQWDKPKFDLDEDLTTIHANQGGGKDDYWGVSMPLPYGTYVLVEQQPTTIPTKHYQIDKPKEITIPFAPQIDPDGTVHDKVPAIEYFYDSRMTPEELVKKYQIRFNEETHIIQAHNQDGDFMVFKYGLEPGIAQDCGNNAVAAYYHYSSISEDAGKKDGVYYETYFDREGNAIDYGVTLDDVDSMSGITTAVDRLYAPALVPWSILDPRYGEIINDNGDIGNREPGLTDDGSFNYIAFAAEDMENHFYSSKIRIEKLDSETGENIIHEGALFKIYAAKRDISGDGGTGVAGTGKVLFDQDGNPLYDEAEQIFMKDETGAEVGIFKAFSTIRDGEVAYPDGSTGTEKRGVGYIETYQPLGAGVYVLVEVQAPAGYVKSNPIAFEVYSDKVGYYPDGGNGTIVNAPVYQYVKEVNPDGSKLMEDVHQIKVFDTPTEIQIHKTETGGPGMTYRVEGSEEQLKVRGDVTLYYNADGSFAGYGLVTKNYDKWSETTVTGTLEELTSMSGVQPLYDERGDFTGKGVRYDIYVPKATLTLYKALKVTRTGPHTYDGVVVKRNWNDTVISITATKSGTTSDIRDTGMTDDEKNIIWDVTTVPYPPMQLLRYDLEVDPTEKDHDTGILYGLNDMGHRICRVDEKTGMAYVLDDKGSILVWPLDENGSKIKTQAIEVHTNADGTQTIYTDLQAVTDENGLPVYYQNGEVILADNEWITPVNGGHAITRIPFGAYIAEETVVPNSQGYIQAEAKGIIVDETTKLQHFYIQNDFTKIEISKLDLTTEKEIPGAILTLYEAIRVPDSSPRGWHLEIAVDLKGNKRVYTSWESGYEYDDAGNLKLDGSGNKIISHKPRWMDHIPSGDYILEETQVPTGSGYVKSDPMEVIIKADGTVQSVVMKDDHTAAEFIKMDHETGEVLSNDRPATLALYQANLNSAGEVIYDDQGNPTYDKANQILEWITDDGIEVKATGHEVPIPGGGGHTQTMYDYDVKPVPGLKNAVYYVTENGALHIDYLPTGKYVWVEEKAPPGMALSPPIYVHVLAIGSQVQVQSYNMINYPVKTDLTKTNMAGGKEIYGAGVAVYQAAADGSLIQDVAHLYERWISGTNGSYTKKDKENNLIPMGFEVGDLKPHTIVGMPAGDYYFVEKSAPYGYLLADPVPFTVTGSAIITKVEIINKIVEGRIVIDKHDRKNESKKLAGAKFKLTNLDTNTSIILITDSNGRIESEYGPIGKINKDGSITPYRFKVQEIEAPDGYELDDTEHYFSFQYENGLVERLTYTYQAANDETDISFSKVDFTTKEELPGVTLRVEETDGTLIEQWVSTDQPHIITGKLVAGESYRYIEAAAPKGYALADPITFTIGRDGTIETVIMEDKPTHVVISKVDITDQKELPGAHLRLKDSAGTVVEEWISTDKPHEIIGTLEAGKSYTLVETLSPDGYGEALEITFTVSQDGSIDKVKMEDRPTHVVITKVAITDQEELPGAYLQLKDSAGKVVEEWISTDQPHEIKGKLVAGESYTLVEVLPPAGYGKASEIVFTVSEDGSIDKVKMEDKPTHAVITKVDITDQEELPGAHLQIRNSAGKVVEEWISTDQPHEIVGKLEAGERYTLVEILPPDGYGIASEFTFTVSEDGSIDKVKMEDKPTHVVITKVDITNQEELPGAHLQLKNNAGTVVEEWISTDQPHEIKGKLVAGESYTLVEILSPEGYGIAKEIKFTVSQDGKIDKVKMEDKPTHVVITKVDITDQEELPGAYLQIKNSAGTVIEEWVSTDQPHEIKGKLVAGESYTLVEVLSPEGYGIAKEVKFTVSQDGKIDKVKMEDKPTHVVITKVDITNQEELPGAHLQLKDSAGMVIEEWISTDQPHEIKGKLAAGENYTLVEVLSPAGYGTASEITFTVSQDGNIDKVKMEDKPTHVVITKVDITDQEELPGAHLQIKDSAGTVIEEWISSDQPHEIKGKLVAGESYTLVEVLPPAGYGAASEITFTVSRDGNIDKVKLEDKPTHVVITKVDITDQEELAGAHLQIRNSTGKVVEEWISTDQPHEIKGKLVAGERYTLVEILPPDGYGTASEITFTVSQDGNIDKVKMEDKPTHVVISKVDITNQEELPGAHLQLKNSVGTVTEEWVSTDQPYEIKGKLVAGESYTLAEIISPEGYGIAKEIIFTVSQDGSIDKVKMEDTPTHAVISKVDITDQEELPGAYMQLKDGTGKVIEEWTSTDKPHEIIGKLVAGESYTLAEIMSPEGYGIAKEVVFTVSQDGSIDKVKMEDSPTHAVISKVDITDQEELPGAHLQLKNSAGKVIEEWISTDKPHEIIGKLIAGERYTLVETLPPDGYTAANEITFTVSQDGSVNKVTMTDKPTCVIVSKKSITGEDELPGAHLQILDQAGNILAEWVSTNQPYEIIGKLKCGDTYTLKEVEAPKGYMIAEPITFTVGENADITHVVMRDKKKTNPDKPDKPNPDPEQYITITKVDTQENLLSGASFTFYYPDGSIYTTAATGPDGTLRILRPTPGTYSFKETKAPDGYYLSDEVYYLVIDENGKVAGHTTIINEKRTIVEIAKQDIVSEEYLPGAHIQILNEKKEVIYEGITNGDGLISFIPNKPGIYYFCELQAPEGYKKNEEMFTFTVLGDGAIEGTTILYNYSDDVPKEKKIGKIIAAYSSKLSGKGSTAFGRTEIITVLPKMGDTSNMNFHLLLLVLASMIGGIAMLFKRKGKQAFILVFMIVSLSGIFSQDIFAEEIKREQTYVTTDANDYSPESFEPKFKEGDNLYRITTIQREITKQQPVVSTIIVTSPAFTDDVKNHIPKDEYKSLEEQRVYRLQSYEIAETYVEEAAKDVTSDIVYENVEQIDQIPKQGDIEVTDEISQETFKVELPLLEYQYYDYRWTDDFEFNITYQSYDAERYMLGNLLIPKNDDRPDLDGHQEELLTMIGCSPEAYKIHSIDWSGEAYTTSEGVFCRDAIAKGEKLVADCRATYGGIVTSPGKEAKEIQATYSYTDDDALEYTIHAVAAYESYTFWDLLKELLQNPIIIGISICILLLLVLFILILFLLAKRRREERSTEVAEYGDESDSEEWVD